MIFHLVHHLLEIPVTIMIGSRIVENGDMFVGITFIGNGMTFVFNYLNYLFYFLDSWCFSIDKHFVVSFTIREKFFLQISY
jgi:hypothetical protein